MIDLDRQLEQFEKLERQLEDLASMLRNNTYITPIFRSFDDPDECLTGLLRWTTEQLNRLYVSKARRERPK